MEYEMVMGFKVGMMGLDTKELGKTIKRMGLGNCIMLTEIYTKENGWMIRLMDRGFILGCMARHTMEIGRMTDSMDLEKKNGLMELSLKDTILRGRSMGKELSDL